MPSQIVEIRSIGTREDNRFTVTIDTPEKDPQSGDFYCRVASSGAQTFRFDAYGVSRQQAMRLALEMTAARTASVLCTTMTEEEDVREGE
jgi:hypothetical protein